MLRSSRHGPWPGGDRYEPGTVVVLRELLDGRVRSARPLQVVEDGQDGLAAYLVPRSEVAWPRLLDGAQSQTPDQGWLLRREEWQGPGCLFVLPPGEAYAAVLFFDRDDARPLSWKVDFLRPPLRHGLLPRHPRLGARPAGPARSPRLDGQGHRRSGSAADARAARSRRRPPGRRRPRPRRAGDPRRGATLRRPLAALAPARGRGAAAAPARLPDGRGPAGARR